MEVWKVEGEEARILWELEISQEMLGTLTTPCVIPLISSISGFPFPLEGFIKLNFDGASKGNPGLARYEGILQEN